MANVVGRGKAAHFRAAVACHAAGMTTIKDGEEARVVGQLAIKLEKIFIDNGGLTRPGEIVRHQAFINMIDLLARIVAWQLRTMPAVKKHALLSVVRVIQQPAQSVQDYIAGGALVQDDSNVLGGKTGFLEK